MSRPLIAHIVHRLDYGGLENGLVNLINGLPDDRFRHAVICLAGYSGFRARIRSAEVCVHSLDKRPGKDLPAYGRLWRLLRHLGPAIVHTRNPGVIDCAVVARAAGVPLRVHGYHGWDVDDLHGTRTRRALLRRACNPSIDRFVAVSRHIARWIEDTDGIDPRRIRQIYNGVDLRRFAPGVSAAAPVFDLPNGQRPFVIGTVGRLEAVKDQATLARAFGELMARQPAWRDHVRLLIVGEGACRGGIQRLVDEAGCAGLARITGWRDDIPELMRQMDVFVLPSLNEGISNTLLEAMASGLPVIATDVGGNGELVVEGETGRLVPVSSATDLATAIEAHVASAALVRQHAQSSRRRAENIFGMDVMIAGYAHLYGELLDGSARNGV